MWKGPTCHRVNKKGRQGLAWRTEKRGRASSRRRPVLPQWACVTSDKLGPLARLPVWVLNVVPNWLHAPNTPPAYLLFHFVVVVALFSARFWFLFAVALSQVGWMYSGNLACGSAVLRSRLVNELLLVGGLTSRPAATCQRGRGWQREFS